MRHLTKEGEIRINFSVMYDVGELLSVEESNTVNKWSTDKYYRRLYIQEASNANCSGVRYHLR